MKKIVRSTLLVLLALCMVLPLFTSCSLLPTPSARTPEACADAYVQAAYEGNLEGMLDLTAGMSYDLFLEIMTAAFSYGYSYDPYLSEKMQASYGTTDISRMVKSAIAELKADAKAENVMPLNSIALEKSRYDEDDTYSTIVRYNQEAVDFFDDVKAYMGDDFNMSDVFLSLDQVKSLRTVNVRVNNNSYNLYVVQIGNTWKILDMDYDGLQWALDKLSSEISSRLYY